VFIDLQGEGIFDSLSLSQLDQSTPKIYSRHFNQSICKLHDNQNDNEENGRANKKRILLGYGKAQIVNFEQVSF
jgi:hypothetical protein